MKRPGVPGPERSPEATGTVLMEAGVSLPFPESPGGASPAAGSRSTQRGPAGITVCILLQFCCGLGTHTSALEFAPHTTKRGGLPGRQRTHLLSHKAFDCLSLLQEGNH